MFDLKKLGASLMGAGAAMHHLASHPVAWWIGLGFIVCSPFLLAMKERNGPRRNRKPFR